MIFSLWWAEYPQLTVTEPIEMGASLWRHRRLVQVLVQREVIGRYRGSVMGILWSFFNPVFMLVIYTFVFSVVFKARWNVDSDSKTEFALVLLRPRHCNSFHAGIFSWIDSFQTE